MVEFVTDWQLKSLPRRNSETHQLLHAKPERPLTYCGIFPTNECMAGTHLREKQVSTGRETFESVKIFVANQVREGQPHWRLEQPNEKHRRSLRMVSSRECGCNKKAGVNVANGTPHSASLRGVVPSDYDVDGLLRLVDVVDGLFDALKLDDAERPKQDDE